MISRHDDQSADNFVLEIRLCLRITDAETSSDF